MALESVSAAETAIQSNDDNDLEDGEIPSDEDDEPVPVPEHIKSVPELPKHTPVKTDSPKPKVFENKFGKNKKSGNVDRLNRQKGATSDDWAGDVEKAIRAALDEDKGKNHEIKPRNKSNKNKNRKRNREEKDEERNRDQKKKKLSDEENANEDDDEMLFVRGASPLRKGSHENSSPRRVEHENYNSGSDYEDRQVSNRHRDDTKRGGGRWAQTKHQQQQLERNKKISIAAGRRGAKNDRGGKNKNRAQLRNDRNSRRNQSNDHNQDPDAICVYYMQGKCHRGDDCPFSHNALPPRKMELCKFYLMDCCAKRDKCLYMHHDFPCKFFHTGLKCQSGENCKFSHQSMSEQVKNILLKHLETAPKEILGNFPRLSRESAMYMISNTEKTFAPGQEALNPKIPSLFELKISVPNDNVSKESGKDDGDDLLTNRDKNLQPLKERKSTTGKKTRWGSDEDRVPYDMVVQSATQLGLQLSNNQEKPQAVSATSINFYNDSNVNDAPKNENELQDDETKAKESTTSILNALPKDVDLRQLLAGAPNSKTSQVVSVAEEAASLTKSKLDDESDRDEETDLVIEMPTDEEDKEKSNKTQETQDNVINSTENPKNSPVLAIQEIPANLPKKTQELYMRIQQQQREAQDSFKNLENTEDHEISQDDWYSDDDDNDDDDDDDDDQLTIVLKDIQKEDEEEQENNQERKDEILPQPSSIPQPAAIVDKLGDLSKIDISMEVSKLLSSIKAQSSSNLKDKDSASKTKKDASLSGANLDNIKTNISDVLQFSKTESDNISPRMSPNRMTGTSSISSQPAAVSRDPRMSRDPRQRRDEQRVSSTGSTSAKSTDSKESRSMRLETSIYSSGIIAQDTVMDTDLRAKLDQDHRRKDMDLRCFAPGSNFGDTDLRLVGGHYQGDTTKSGDVDLRQMLSLPFKPVPTHVPCTEIDAGLSSHPPMTYKVYVVDVPRPDYTGLKLTRHDPQVKYDPRLRKIFRLGKDDLADSPMSPPPVKILDTPKSPPLVRTDPRRKALEVSAPKVIPTTLQQHPVQDHPSMGGMPMGMANSYMQGSNPMSVPVMQGMVPQQIMGSQNMAPPQGMGPPQMMMGGNPMMGSMAPMMRDGSVMGNPEGRSMPMRMGGMGPPVPNHQQLSGPPQSQMGKYDPRYNTQRNSGVGLLGAGPQQMGYNPDGRSQFDGPPTRYPNDNFSNYGNPPNSDRSDPRGFNPNGQLDEPNYGNNQLDWNNGPNRANRKDRRRATRGKFGGLPRKKDNIS